MGDLIVDEFDLVTGNKRHDLQLADAIVGSPELELTIDGASTLRLQIADHDRTLTRSESLTTRSWARVEGVNFELVGSSKSGDMVTLTFEDAIAATLRRRKGKLRIPANSTTRREIITRLAREARVKVDVDDDKRGKVHNLVERTGTDSSWDLTGTLASDVGWRRFSNGTRLVIGSDDWLLGQDDQPTKVREHTGPWGAVDFDTDTGRRAATATVVVDAAAGAITPGSVVLLEDPWPAVDGKWLVQTYARRLTATRGTVTLTRTQRALKEPKGTGGRSDAPDRGESDYLPGADGDVGTTGSTSQARERMVTWALAQKGKPYLWAGNGPGGFDCSGLVQEASRAAGKVLTKPSKSQWATCQSAGVTIPVAQALSTRGALLFVMTGDPTHVAISLGNGSTVEARGTAYGVGVFGDAASRGWTGGALWI